MSKECCSLGREKQQGKIEKKDCKTTIFSDLIGTNCLHYPNETLNIWGVKVVVVGLTVASLKILTYCPTLVCPSMNSVGKGSCI